MPARRRALWGAMLASLALLPALPAAAQRLYWEEPRILVPDAARFPAAASGGGLIAAVWQEFTPRTNGGQEVWLSAAVSSNARDWPVTARFAGPFPSQERETTIFSLAVDGRGFIYLAVASADRETTILRSTDRGKRFTVLAKVEAFTTSLAPSLFITSRGELLLFATQESAGSLALYFAVSRDGTNWPAFKLLLDDPRVPTQFLPFHAVLGGRDYVVFQTLRRVEQTSETQGYQLMLESSSDGGHSWGSPRALLFNEIVAGTPQDSSMFSNQRPFLLPMADRLGLVWERRLRNAPSQIYYLELDGQGNPLGSPQPVSAPGTAAYFPRLVRFRGRSYVSFFGENDQVYFVAREEGGAWLYDPSRPLSTLSGSSIFAYPVELADRLYVLWENRAGGSSKLVLLQPDQTVRPPEVFAVNFDPGVPSRLDQARVRWVVPRDPSGIAGFRYVWSQNPNEPVPHDLINALPDVNRATVAADKDGRWYFRIEAQDFAGNWSPPATVAFTRKTTAPGAPALALPPADPAGTLQSNSFTLGWKPPEPEADVAGYAYALQYLGTEPPATAPAAPPLPGSPNTAAPQASFRNLDNGYWVFAVASVDQAGNRSAPTVAVLHLDKYVPVTYISYVNERRDPLGGLDLTIGGRGFEAGGEVEQVLVDRDGRPPYDLVLKRRDGGFQPVSDRLIRDVRLPELAEGQYRVGVLHSLRGLAWTGPVLSIASQGTLKIGDFSFQYRRAWLSARLLARTLGAGTLAVGLVSLFLLALLLLSAGRLAALAQEGRLLRMEVLAVLRGEAPLARKVARMEELKRRGAGLRLKFTALTMILVLIIVLLVSLPISVYMIATQSRTLVNGLTQRVDTLMGSLASSTIEVLKDPATADLGLAGLTDQARTMAETQYVTVTGPGLQDPLHFDYVLVSSDPDIDQKLARGTYTGNRGVVRIQDDVSKELEAMASRIDAEAKQKVGDLVQQLADLRAEAVSLALRTDEASKRRVQAIQEELNTRNARISQELLAFKGLNGSVPKVEVKDVLPFYIFYKPIVARPLSGDDYFQGAVRLGVSTDTIRGALVKSRQDLLIRIGIVALAAALLGLIGAIIMAAITINPIKKLAAGVAVIRDTEDKEKLKDHRIEVSTRDEIGTLANTVNQMTQALVKAAIASKDLTVGKEVQKMFLPLAKDELGEKGTTAGEQDNLIEIFGYYEGAKGVSGDYFDYVKLADKYYAMIKCDVAGKGVPAALIMVEVATIFSTFFRNWTPKSPGLKIDQLAYLINDMLEERGFKGRFAALTLAILNAETGQVWFCNAGDTTLRLYRRAEGRMNAYKLPQAPAAGVFPSMIVQAQAGFQQVPYQLASGDTVFLYTDGVEEAKRHFRDTAFNVVACAEPGLQDNESHGGTHNKGADNEEMGDGRIRGIIDAVFGRREYRLVKHHNPMGDEPLAFDFGRCQGTVEEAVLAMVSAEKVFRLYPDPSAGPDDRVYVDKRIDAFLRAHFSLFDRYFGHPLAGAEGVPAGTVAYTHLKEDEQYDDLTILAVRKK
jgi:serine phosphatase RsbU (regulator of sigma subunit)